MKSVLVVATLLIGFAAPASSQPEGLPTDFGTPAQAGPVLHTTNGTWALLLFSESSSADMQLNFPAGSLYTNRTLTAYGDASTEISQHRGRRESTEQTSTIHAPVDADLALSVPTGAFGSLFISGHNIQVQSFDATGQLVGKREQDCVSALLSKDLVSSDALRAGMLCPPGQNAVVAVTIRDASQPFPFNVEAAEILSAEWHSLDIHCADSSSCPSGGVHQQDRTTLPGNTTITNSQFGYPSLETSSPGSLAGNGTAVVLLVGGFELDVAVDGFVRLPSTQSRTCSNCTDPAGQTLAADGHIELKGLRPSGDGRLAATLGGNINSVRLDEVSIDPSLLGLGTTAAAAVAAAAGAAFLLKWLLWPLFTRRTDKDLLDNDRRRRLYEFVVKNPGVHFREALRGVGIPSGSGRHHVTHLVRAGLLVERRVGSKLRLFEGGRPLRDGWQDMAALRDPKMRLLHDWILENPERSQKEILAAFRELHGWNASTTQGRLARLVKDGIVRAKAKGRRKHYAVAKAAGFQVAETPTVDSVPA